MVFKSYVMADLKLIEMLHFYNTYKITLIVPFFVEIAEEMAKEIDEGRNNQCVLVCIIEM